MGKYWEIIFNRLALLISNKVYGVTEINTVPTDFLPVVYNYYIHGLFSLAVLGSC